MLTKPLDSFGEKLWTTAKIGGGAVVVALIVIACVSKCSLDNALHLFQDRWWAMGGIIAGASLVSGLLGYLVFMPTELPSRLEWEQRASRKARGVYALATVVVLGLIFWAAFRRTLDFSDDAWLLGFSGGATGFVGMLSSYVFFRKSYKELEPIPQPRKGSETEEFFYGRFT